MGKGYAGAPPSPFFWANATPSYFGANATPSYPYVSRGFVAKAEYLFSIANILVNIEGNSNPPFRA